MSYVKYTEDDIKINDDRVFNIHHHSNNPLPKQEVFVCPYCSSVFETRNRLLDHIERIHNNRKAILLINNKIPNNNEIYVDNITEVIVHAYVENILISINDKNLELPLGKMDITSYVSSELKKNDNCTIVLPNKTITVKLYKLEEIRNEKVNSIIQKWQKETENKKIIKNVNNAELNVVERQYLNGFYNYFLACNSQGTDKRDRYYDAFSLLNSFESISGIGKSVLKVIAFKFNWINRLNVLCTEEDEFLNIRNYYYNQPNSEIEQLDGNYLFIEDELRDDMNAMLDYQKGNMKNVRDYLNRNDDLMISDINRKDRIYMIQARKYLLDGEERKSRVYYEDIRNEFMHEDAYMKDRRS